MKTQIRDLGMFMRLAVEGAINIAQTEAANYQRIQKVHYDGKQEDLVTSADLKAQAHYQTLVNTHFPNNMLVGEETKDQIEFTGPRFVCDPVDGTKAYGRNQSTGVATMFAHADGDDIDAVCIGDVNTGEIYQYAPDLSPTRTRFEFTSFLNDNWEKPLEKQYVLLKDVPDEFPKNIQQIVRIKRGGIFKDMEVTSGSIGIAVARLWKQEVAMILLPPSYETPWDSTPLIGMNRQLGIVNIEVDSKTGEAKLHTPKAPTKVEKRNHVEILIHKSYADQVINWLNERKAE